MTNSDALWANDEPVPVGEIPRIDWVASRKRLDLYAETLGVKSPESMEDADGAPSDELMAFCFEYGASLDWIYGGDLTRMIHACKDIEGSEGRSIKSATAAYLDDVQKQAAGLTGVVQALDGLLLSTENDTRGRCVTLCEMAVEMARDLNKALDSVSRPEIQQ